MSPQKRNPDWWRPPLKYSLPEESAGYPKYLVLGYNKEKSVWEPRVVANYRDVAEMEARDLSSLEQTWFKVEEVGEDDPRIRTPGIFHIEGPSPKHERHRFYTLSIRLPFTTSKAGVLALRLSRTHLFIPSTDVEAVRDRVRKVAIKLKK
jgi:hypothetical protein